MSTNYVTHPPGPLSLDLENDRYYRKTADIIGKTTDIIGKTTDIIGRWSPRSEATDIIRKMAKNLKDCRCLAPNK